MPAMLTIPADQFVTLLNDIDALNAEIDEQLANHSPAVRRFFHTWARRPNMGGLLSAIFKRDDTPTSEIELEQALSTMGREMTACGMTIDEVKDTVVYLADVTYAVIDARNAMPKLKRAIVRGQIDRMPR